MADDEKDRYHAAIAELVQARPSSVAILPPKDVLFRVEKTAETLSRQGNKAPMLGKLRENPRTDFVNEESPYHPYWQWRLDEIAAGRGIGSSKAASTIDSTTTAVTFQGKQVKVPEKPADFQFSARMPIISAQDFDVIKLTAKYAAANGQAWVNQLSQKMAGNPDFDFLRRQHSLYLFYESLRDQYKSLIDSEAGGDTLKKRMAELEANIKDPHRLLERARRRAEYNKYTQSQKEAKEAKAEQERIAYAQIDWHNFTVIQPAIVFDEEDDARDLPPPMSLQDLQSQSLEQRAAMRVGVDRRLEEAVPFMDEDTPLPAAQVPSYPYPQSYGLPPDDNPTLQAERDRARALQDAARAHAAAAPRIVTNYVPAAQRRRAQQADTSICPNCHQAIPNAELEHHMRIELLDPQWREQSRIAAQRSSTTNLSTADVANNLKRLASQRADVFDQVTGLPLTEEEQARRKRVELQSYDGQSAAGAYGAQLPPGMAPPPGSLDVNEQIRRLHEKHAGR